MLCSLRNEEDTCFKTNHLLLRLGRKGGERREGRRKREGGEREREREREKERER